MKISYIRDSDLLEGTVNLIKALRKDKRFEKRIRTTRDILGMPPDSFSDGLEKAVNFLQKTFEYKGKAISNKRFLQFLSQQIVDEFRLPKNWGKNIEELVLFDFALIYEGEIVLDFPDLVSNPQQTPFISINLYAKIKRNQLNEWLDGHFKTIEDHFERMRFQKPSKVNRKYTELMIEAKELWESGIYKTVKDVSNELAKKYKDDIGKYELVSNEEIVRNWIHRLISDIYR